MNIMEIYMPTSLLTNFICATKYKKMFDALIRGDVNYIEEFIDSHPGNINTSLNKEVQPWTSFALALYLYRRELDPIKKHKYQELLLLLIDKKPDLRGNSCIRIELKAITKETNYSKTLYEDTILVLILSWKSHLKRPKIKMAQNIAKAYLKLKSPEKAIPIIHYIIDTHLLDCNYNAILSHIILNLIPHNHSNQLQPLFKILENKSAPSALDKHLCDGINYLYGVEENSTPNPRRAIEKFDEIGCKSEFQISIINLITLIARYHLALLPETLKKEYSDIIFGADLQENQYHVLACYAYYSIAQRSHILQLQSNIFSLATNNEERDVLIKQLLAFFTAENALPKPDINLLTQYLNLLHEKIILRKEIFLKHFIDLLKNNFYKAKDPAAQRLYVSQLKTIFSTEVKNSYHEAYAKKSYIECNVLNNNDATVLKQAADEYQEVLNAGIGSYTFISKLYNRLGKVSKDDEAISYYAIAALLGDTENLLLAARIAVTLPARFQNALSLYDTVAKRYVDEKSPTRLIKLKEELIKLSKESYDDTHTLDHLILGLPDQIKKAQEFTDRDYILAIFSDGSNIDMFRFAKIELEKMLAIYPDGEMNNMVRERLDAIKQQINAIELAELASPANTASDKTISIPPSPACSSSSALPAIPPANYMLLASSSAASASSSSSSNAIKVTLQNRTVDNLSIHSLEEEDQPAAPQRLPDSSNDLSIQAPECAASSMEVQEKALVPNTGLVSAMSIHREQQKKLSRDDSCSSAGLTVGKKLVLGR